MSVIASNFGHAAMIEPVEHLLGAQSGGLGVEPGFLEQRGDLRAGQTDQVDPAILARSPGAERARDRHGREWACRRAATRQEDGKAKMGAFMRRSIRFYAKIASGGDGPSRKALGGLCSARRSQPVIASLGAPAKGATSETECRWGTFQVQGIARGKAESHVVRAGHAPGDRRIVEQQQPAPFRCASAG
jgi:hypothetical protein